MSWIFQELDCQQSTKQAKHTSEWRDDQNQFGKTGASNGSRDLAPSRGFIYHLDHPLGTSQMCFYWIGIAPFCAVHLFWMLSIAWEKPDYSFAVRNCVHCETGAWAMSHIIPNLWYGGTQILSMIGWNCRKGLIKGISKMGVSLRLLIWNSFQSPVAKKFPRAKAINDGGNFRQRC